MPESLEDVCRLCLSKEGIMLPIFSNQKSSPNFSFRYKLITCADIQVFADDGLYPKVCHKCYHQVERSFEFRNMCEKSHALHMYQGQRDQDDTQGQIHCFGCKRTFKVILDCLRHIQVEHANCSMFVCTMCSTAFPDVDQLTVHTMEMHKDPNQCHKCDHIFLNEKNLETHKESHIAVQCKYCKYIFDDAKMLKSHEVEHLKRTCQFCCKEFSNPQLCEEHSLTCSQLHNCKLCEEAFSQRKDLILHVTTVHENIRKHKCRDCNKEFDKWEQLQDHSCDVNEDNLHCRICNIFFTDLSLLESHMFAHNTQVLVCKFCTKKFSLRGALRRHEKTHTGQKSYQCSFCPRKFKDNSTCVVHMRTHTGEQPFECVECHRQFKQLANLKMHTYRHHRKGSKVKTVNRELASQSQEFVDERDVPTQMYNTDVLQAVNEYTIDQNRVYQVLDMNVSAFDHSVPL